MKKIYVGNLSYDATEDDLRALFSQHGTVTSVRLVVDKFTSRPKGFAFVEMDDAGSAIEALDGQEFMGRPLRVSEARERAEGDRGNGGGGGRGGFGGGRGGGGGGRRHGGGGHGGGRGARGGNY